MFLNYKSTMRLVIPLIIAQLIYSLNGLIVTNIISQLGRDALAANALIWWNFNIFIKFFSGILGAVSILISQNHGAKYFNKIRIIRNQGIILSFVFTVLLMIVMRFVPDFLLLTGQDPDIVKLSIPYLSALSWSALPCFLLATLEQFLIGISSVSLVLLISLLKVSLEIFFCYVFTFGKLGFPNLGIGGIGFGLTTAYTITAIIVFMTYMKQSNAYKFNMDIFNMNLFAFDIIKLGLPIGVMSCVESLFFSVTTLLIGRFGKDILAAHQIARQYLVIAAAVLIAFSQNTTASVGQKYGKNDWKALKLAVRTNLSLGIYFMLLFACVYFFFAKEIITLCFSSKYVSNYSLSIQYTISILHIVAILLIVEVFRYIFSATLNGLGDTKSIMYINVLSFLIITLPVIYFLSFKNSFEGVGIWYAQVIGILVNVCLLFIRLKSIYVKL